MWGYLQLEIRPEDLLVTPQIGVGLAREAAHAQVQGILDRVPAFAAAASIWRGGAKDDTVFSMPFAWAIFSYDGDDPVPAARTWIQDWVQVLRKSGMDVQIGS